MERHIPVGLFPCVAHIEYLDELTKGDKMNLGFCAHCGASMKGVPSEWMTCRKQSCIRKLGLFCDDVTDRWLALCYPETEAVEAGQRREFRNMVWSYIARPVTAADHSVLGMGNKRAASVLPNLLLKDGVIPPELDGDLYGRLVANGWVEFSDYVYRKLLGKEASPTA